MSITTRDRRLVHRHVDRGIAGDAGHGAERLLHGLSQRDADVFGVWVMVDVEVAIRLHRDVDAGMAGEQVQHVIEEADAGRELAMPVPSRFTATSMSVSLVLRLMVALRMESWPSFPKTAVF